MWVLHPTSFFFSGSVRCFEGHGKHMEALTCEILVNTLTELQYYVTFLCRFDLATIYDK